MFQGNAKTKITNDKLSTPIISIVNECLDKVFADNSNILDIYTKLIRLNAKARVEMQEMKTATQTEKMNTFKDLLLDKYTPANNHGKGQFRALYLVEGDSAGGSLRDGGNPATDAILRLRGATVNAAKCKTVADLMKNREVSTLVNVMRCGIGKRFNLDNLWFERIYISTDADTDGDGISDQIITIFYLFFPEIIRAGKLYKLLNPLYHLDDGTKDGLYVKNKEELIRI
jgi:DNA gyrase/topoisomerase IV subunit B